MTDEKLLKGDLSSHYFSIATHYYVAARFSAYAKLIPVAGNLFHHAVEMYLKGVLCRQLTTIELKRNLGHDLPLIWNAFKEYVADSTLDRFDETISTLHDFENLRYPDQEDGMVTKGMLCHLEFESDVADEISKQTQTTEYKIVVDHIDILVKIIFDKAEINPQFFTKSLQKDAMAYLKVWNKTRIGG